MSESNLSSSEEIIPENESLAEENEEVREEETSPIVPLPEYILNNAVTMQTIMEIEQHFKRGTRAYSEEIQEYNIAIGKVKNEITILQKSMEKEEALLLEIQAKIAYQEHLLQRFNEDFFKQISVIEDLQREYKSIVAEEDYSKVKKAKENKLKYLHDEIEELELLLLSEELERLNLLGKVEPQRNTILSLQAKLRELELEKEHFESTKIHTISQLGFLDNQEEVMHDKELVETVVIAEDDLKQ